MVLKLTSEQTEALFQLVQAGKSLVVKAAPGAGKTSFFMSAVTETVLPGTFLGSTSVPSRTGEPAAAGGAAAESAKKEVRTTTPKMVIVSYNTSLKEETTQKLAALQEQHRTDCGDLFDSVGVMTYHGLISHYANRIVSNDLELHTVLEQLKSGEIEARRSKWDEAELLLLDESQDMRLDYCHLLLFLIQRRFCSPRLRVALVGDERQLLYSMYAVNYADTRFLTMAPEYMTRATGGRLQFADAVQFTQSFRLNAAGASFATALLHAPWNSTALKSSPVIVPASQGTESTGEATVQDGTAKVHLIVANLYSDLTKTSFGDTCPLTILERLQANGSLHDSLLLFNSLNSRSVAKKLVQAATRSGIPLLVEASGDIASSSGVFCAAPPESVLEFKKHRESGSSGCQGNARAKVKTFHASKGLQRAVTLVHNLKPLFPLENDVFVAATRQSSELFFFQDASKVSAEHLQYLRAKVPAEFLEVHTWREPKLQSSGRAHVPPPLSGPSASAGPGLLEGRTQTADRGDVLDPVLAKKAFAARKKQMYKPVENFFRFMDIQHVNSLNRQVSAEFETQPAFSVDSMYFSGNWENEARPPSSSSSSASVLMTDPEADAGAFIRFCDEKGPGTIGVLGNIIILALHWFFYGEPPAQYQDAAQAYGTGERYRQLFRTTVQEMGSGVQSRDFWERIRQIQMRVCHLARLHVEYLATQAFEDSTVQSFEPSICVHPTVFRRMEGAARLLHNRMGFGDLPLAPQSLNRWKAGMVQMPEHCTVRYLTADAFAGTPDGLSVALLRSSLKTEIEDTLEAAVASVVFKCREALVFNVLDLSVQKISVRDASPEGKMLFLEEAVRAKHAEKVFFSDEQFITRALSHSIAATDKLLPAAS